MKKRVIYSEIPFLLSLIIMSFAVAMLTAANFGISMVVAPSYILSERIGFLSFGMAEYVVQGMMFIIFCIIVRKCRLIYFSSFVSCLLHGAFLDLFRVIIPLFNPNIVPAGSMSMWIRILLFIVGQQLLAASVALGFKSYLLPQTNDFLVKAIADHFHKNVGTIKYIFDGLCLATALVMTLTIFGKLVGIGWGTFVLMLANGFFIGKYSQLLDKIFSYRPLFPRFSRIYEEHGASPEIENS